MSVENVRFFYEKVKNDLELHERFTQIIKQDSENLAEGLIEFAKELGYLFNVEDVKKYSEEMLTKLNKNGALSEEEMAEIAGGGSLISRPEFDFRTLFPKPDENLRKFWNRYEEQRKKFDS